MGLPTPPHPPPVPSSSLPPFLFLPGFIGNFEFSIMQNMVLAARYPPRLGSTATSTELHGSSHLPLEPTVLSIIITPLLFISIRTPQVCP